MPCQAFNQRNSPRVSAGLLEVLHIRSTGQEIAESLGDFRYCSHDRARRLGDKSAYSRKAWLLCPARFATILSW